MFKKKMMYISLGILIASSLGVAVSFAYASSGQINLMKENITIQTRSLDLTYNGESQIKTTSEARYEGDLSFGDTFITTPTETEYFNAGISKNKIAYKILDRNGHDVTTNYNVIENFGTVTVKPRSITLSTNVNANTLNDSGILEHEQLIVGGDGVAPTDRITAKYKREFDGTYYSLKLKLNRVENTIQNRIVTKNYIDATNFGSLDSLPDIDLPDDIGLPNTDLNMGADIDAGPLGDPINIFTYKSTKPGLHYFRGESFGDYDATNDRFNPAVGYNNTYNTYNPNDFFLKTLKNNKGEKREIEIEYLKTAQFKDYDFVPYFYEGNESQENDLYYKLYKDSENKVRCTSYWSIPQTNLDYYQGLTNYDPMFRREEENYYNFVQMNYTACPYELNNALDEFLNNNNLTNLSLDQFDKKLSKIISRDFTYKLSGYEAENNKLDGFINRDKYGNCQNFASAATLLYRKIGYPARYITGFVDVLKEANVEKKITQFNAHAWVEIYLKGVGWIPLEYTVFSIGADETLGNENEWVEDKPSEDGNQEGEGGNQEGEGKPEEIDPNATNISSGIDHRFSDVQATNYDYSFSVHSNKPGKIYLREESYGDYNLLGFRPADIYKVDGHNEINPNTIFSDQLHSMYEGNIVSLTNLDVNRTKELVPYYLSTSLNILPNAYNDITFEPNNLDNSSYNVIDYDLLRDGNIENLQFTDYGGSKEVDERYSKFVRKKYLEVPNEFKNKILEGIKKVTPVIPNNPVAIIQLVSDYLANSNIKFNPFAPTDFQGIEGALSSIMSNNDVNLNSSLFAGGVTLYLRSLGVPTRLVGGYLYIANDTSTKAISEFNRYYWNEVYLKGHGWVKVDLLSSSGKLIEKYYEGKQLATVVIDSVDKEFDGQYTDTNPYILEGDGIFPEDEMPVFDNLTYPIKYVGEINPTTEFYVYNFEGEDVTYKYAIRRQFGTQIIREKTINVYANSASEKFVEGKVLESGIERIEGINMFDYTIDYTTTKLYKKGIIESEVVINSITDASGDDVTDCFNIVYFSGTLELY